MEASGDKKAGAKASRRKVNLPVALGGVLAILLSLGLLGYGLAPAGAFGEVAGVFSGGKPPPDLADKIQGAMDGLGARVVWDALGGAFLLGGIVAVQFAMRKPKPKSVETLVQEEVERRLAQAAPPSQAVSAPAIGAFGQAAPLAGTPAILVPSPVPASPVIQAHAGETGRCPRCGRALLGGRFCRVCDR